VKLSRPQDAIHRGQIYQLLIEIADNPFLAKNLIFKGGTCAALLKKLDRFSVDLDFDLLPDANQTQLDSHLKKIFTTLDLTIKDSSQKVLQYYLKYKVPTKQHSMRNTLKLDAVNTVFQADTFTPQFLADIDRYFVCQNIETMFAHKLVALTNRYDKHKSIAGRDLYDIHYFFLSGHSYNSAIIVERTGLTPLAYFHRLLEFIQKKVTQTIINQDLNFLIEANKFKSLRKSLKPQVITLIKDEIQRLT